VALALVGWPFLLLLSGLIWVFAGFSAAWHTALVLTGLLLVVGLVLAVLTFREQLNEICWIELQPPGEPTVVMFKKVRGAESIAVADLRSVSVVEKFKLGGSTGSEIVFDTAAARSITCPGTILGPRLMVPAATVGKWFADRLEPAGITVTHETVLERANPPIQNWYTAVQVAAVWQVPVQDVDRLADQLAVRSQMFTPRVGALHGVNRKLTTMIYNPDDVHIVAADVPTTSQ
jgi:hypothetical protein